MDNYEYDPQRPPMGPPPPPPYGDIAPMSVKDWVITMLICCIPCVGIVMQFVWAFGNGNLNRKNWARAGLILSLVMIVLMFVWSMFFGGMLFLQRLAEGSGSMALPPSF